MKTLLIVLSAFLVLASVARADTFVYVSDSRENAIKIFRVDLTSGALVPVESLAVAGAPGSLATDPQRRFLFASLRSTSTLASYAIDPSSGRLALINSAPLAEGANATYVATDLQGRFLLTASYSGGRVTVHELSAEGKIGDRPVQVVETAKTAHAAVINADNRLVFVPHVASNLVYQFRFNPATGHLEELSRAPGGRENAGPRHLALHPSGRFAFTSDEQGSSTTLYELDADSGLKPLQTLSTLPDNYAEKNTTADVKVHPSGKFVWVSNRGHDSLAGFAFDESSGVLKAIGQTPTEKTPRSFAVDPTGRFLYCGGEGTGKLAAYHIDSASGALNRFQTYDVGTSLSWVAIVSR